MARRRQRDWKGDERRDAPLVLVVNDDPDAAELLSRLLSHHGYRTATTGGIDDTMEQLVDLLPRCVVLDLTHGGIGSNLKLLEIIRHHHDQRVATSRVVVVVRQAANRVFSFQSGADAFLVRPFHADELVRQVEKVVSMPFADLPQHRRQQLDTGS